MCNHTKTKRFENKVVIVTGGASGIGEATARSFAEHGARAVVIADIQKKKGQQVAESIGSHLCTFMKCDVSDEEQVKNLVDSTVKKYGQLDIMFSNAGIAGNNFKHDILNFDFKAYETLFSINVRGMIACVKHAGRAMVDGGIKGSIICTSSVMATNVAAPVAIDYTMSKHAVLGLVKCTSKGLGQYGIRVNSVSPAAVPTPLSNHAMGMSSENVEKHFESASSLKIGALKAKNIADAVLFLTSEESQFITGQNLVVDGGYTVI